MYRFTQANHDTFLLTGYEGDYDKVISRIDLHLEEILTPYFRDGFKVVVFCSSADKFILLEKNKTSVF